MRNKCKKLCAGMLAAFFFLAAPLQSWAATDLSSFPDSYRYSLQQMMNAHPNWSFEPFYTGIKWSDAMAYETEVNVNLIEQDATVPDSWLSKKQNVTFRGGLINLYDYQTKKYYIFSSPNWVQPTDEVIAYYLDPRNFLNDTDVFMFKHMIFNAGYHTPDTVNAVLKGSWMYNARLEDNPSMTYAQAFYNIGKELGISPFLLATRVVQEQGVYGTSPLISGTYPGYSGYYNYFNIGATGQTSAEIYANGLNEAKNAGWNTRYKALRGGAEKILTRYNDRNQTTMYFQKFDVANGAVGYHQYMQNVRAPYSEGRRVRNSYQNCGILESAFVFRIPIYENMPAGACQPDGSLKFFPQIKPSVPVENPQLGDVDRNGSVGAEDAILVLKSIVSLETLDDAQVRLADVNGADGISVEDAILILKYLVRLIEKFPAA